MQTAPTQTQGKQANLFRVDDRVYSVAQEQLTGTITELNAAVPGMVRVAWDNPQVVKPAPHRLSWWNHTELGWYTRPEVLASGIAAELLTRFPWLETDDQANGGDVVDALSAWYQEVK